MAPVDDLLEALEDLTPSAGFRQLERVPHGYAHGYALTDQDGQLGQVWWGGSFEHPHATFQGHASHAAAMVLRECFPGSPVSRCDPVLIDSMQPGAYDVLQDTCTAVAREMRVKVGTAGDHLVTLEGRTLYLGATKSGVRLRLYDKAAERRSKINDPDKLASLPASWARVEAQIRPHGREARLAAATASPTALLGSAKWLQAVARSITGLDVPRFQASPAWRQSDHDRAYRAMLTQYGSTLRQVLADAGSPECFGLQLSDDLRQM
jgi:hypothetical protein